MNTSGDAPQTGGEKSVAKDSRLRSLAMIVIFDIAAPLVTYNLLRSAGQSAVTALLLSGIFPAIGVTINAIRNRRLDAIGVLVLAGIVVGTILGLAFHSARLLLVEGSVPTGVFGLVCLGSLWAGRPLMFTMAVEFIGPDSAKGREMIGLWQGDGIDDEYRDGFRRVFRIITAVWGVGFLAEAALRVVIVYNTSTGTALAVSKVTPFVFAGIFMAWTFAYGTYQRKKGERMAAAARQVQDPSRVSAVSPPQGDDARR